MYTHFTKEDSNINDIKYSEYFLIVYSGFIIVFEWVNADLMQVFKQ